MRVERDKGTEDINILCILPCLFFLFLFPLSFQTETQQTVVYQSVAVSLGLLINSLAFVIYYAIDEPTPFFAIVLWFTEIVPTLMLLYMLSPRRYL